MAPIISDTDPLGRQRRRRRVSVFALVAAVLSSLVYQINGRSARSPDSSARSSTQARRNTVSRDAPIPDAINADTASANNGFDFYLLALSLAPAFCEDGHQGKRECSAMDAQSFAQTPLTLHGLWPENIRAESYPRACQGPALRLSTGTRTALRRWMPGELDGLAEHEWSTHGRCTGLDADHYFTAAMDWTQQLNAALGAAVQAAAGGRSGVATLRAAANAVHPGIGDSLVFVCKNLRHAASDRQRRPHLIEVRACLNNDGVGAAPRSLLRCADVQRRDQGCGASFEIDTP